MLIGSFSAQGSQHNDITQAESKIEQLNKDINQKQDDLKDSQNQLSDFKKENAKYIELGKKEYQKVKAIEDEAEAARQAQQQAAAQQGDATTVYITNTGRRYHLSPYCRGLNPSKSTTPTTLSNAIAAGYTRCKFE